MTWVVMLCWASFCRPDPAASASAVDGATKDWEKDKVWDADPVLRPFRDIPPFGRLAGYAGPNRKAAQVVTKYIITDMYAKAIQGMPTEAAVKTAHDEVAKTYA